MVGSPKPFGTYGLTPWRERLRLAAGVTPDGKPGMWLISIMRKISLLGHETGMRGPLDVEVAPGVNARLFPSSNRCEKRAYAGVHIWDAQERATLDHAVSQMDPANEFVFLDVGANVGLYSLFVNASAKSHRRKVKIVAVEPDLENRSRMKMNFDSSNCIAFIEPIGISEVEGEGILTEAEENRGGISIRESGPGEKIRLETLSGLIKRHKLTHIDAMKIDIEGRDEAALRSMLRDTPETIWPRLLIVETGRDDNSPILKQMTDHGYQLKQRVGINAILSFDPLQRVDEGQNND